MDPLNPAPFLLSLVGQRIDAKTKWGFHYVGMLLSCDAYMNLQMRDCVEFVPDGQSTELGEVLIRCNNVLYIRGAKADEKPPGSKSAS